MPAKKSRMNKSCIYCIYLYVCACAIPFWKQACEVLCNDCLEISQHGSELNLCLRIQLLNHAICCFPLYGFLVYLWLGIFKATILVLTSNSSYESNGSLHLNDQLLLTVSHSPKFYLPVTPKRVPIFLTSAFPSTVKHMVYRRYGPPIKPWEAHGLGE